jgi:hypothetical protein
LGLIEKCSPPTEASYINPPFVCVKIAIPFLKAISTDTSAIIVTAEAWPSNFTFF